MSIDWFTFVAQVLNFVVLVWLLKRFLYRPILGAIEAREKRIAAELENAIAAEAEAQQERNKFERNNSDFEEQRAALLDQARAEAKTEYERLVEEARAATDELTRKRMAALENSVANLGDGIRRRIQQEVFAISRKVLTELASQNLEESMIASLLVRLQALDAGARQELRNAMATEGYASLRSAFELSSSQRSSIKRMLGDIAGTDIELRCETLPDLVSGIEIVASGQKLAWSISDYLASLEKSVTELAATDNKPRHQTMADDGSAQPVS